MFWVPQPVTAIGVVPAGAGVVSFDSYGQATFQQPLQVVGVLPAFTAGVSGFAGFAKGVAGAVLGAGAAMNGNNNGRSGRARRQPKRERNDSNNLADAKDESGEVEDWHECQEFETTDKSEVFDATPGIVFDDELSELMAQLEKGEDPKPPLASIIHGKVLDLALDPRGCRLIQLALDASSQKQAAELTSELRGHIRTLIQSKHGNYVVQKMVEVLPTSMASFIVEEIRSSAGELARHRYGCRILCRLFEHSGTEGATAELIKELVSEARELSRHAYGYHVMRCILEHGLPEHRHHIAYALCNGVQRHAKHRHASFVVEKALAHCEEQARELVARELLQRPENVVDLARHQFGRHVVSQLVRIPGECSQMALHNLREGLPQVQTSKHGRRLIEGLKQQLMVSATS